jgi:DNA-directed RNA polymerase specialized sigma subunit
MRSQPIQRSQSTKAAEERLQAVLAELTRRQRLAFDLLYEKGLSRKRVALELGVGRAAVCKITARIRSRFFRHGLNWVPALPAEPGDFRPVDLPSKNA